MSDTVLDVITRRSRTVIAALLVLTLVVGSGATAIDQDTALDQFETESPEADALEYVDGHFGADEDTTTAQIVVRDENVLDRDSLVATLELQQELRANETVNETLASDPFSDVAMVVAQNAIIDERIAELDERASELENDSAELEAAFEDVAERGSQLETDRAALENRSETLEQQREALAEDRRAVEQWGAFMQETLNETRALQTEYDQLNESLEQGEIDQNTYESESDRIDSEFEALDETARANLTADQYESFAPLVEAVRQLQAEQNEAEAAAQAGEISEEETERVTAATETEMAERYADIEEVVLAEELADIERRGEDLEAEAEVLEERGQELADEADDLEQRQAALEDRADALEQRQEAVQEGYEELPEIDPTASEAIDQLESMNDDEIAAAVEDTLGEDAEAGVFSFLPTDFEPGSTQADARMVFVTQEATDDIVQGEAPPEIEDAQLSMASIVDEQFENGFVFGAGLVADEIDRSMADSLVVVLPLALLFVTVVLVVAYRDLLDILIGLAGIGLVLVWTFGFMGWANISFNQLMVAVPVLLVGLSVDYAIHVFMRHREHREERPGASRRAMGVALGGVGLALVWVTATAVIGFLSNLVSPVGPIREFGIVSAVGIGATLLIFGVFVPAIKLELDEILERRGFDRHRPAFGTGGGAFTSFLSLGQWAAGRMPWAVVFVVLAITGGGVVGATQVDTTFQEEDFIADEPPDWMDQLPEPFAPGTYAVKENLEYVNENFLREDARTQVLVEGNVTGERTLERIDEAEAVAAEQHTTVVFPTGEADVQSPLSVMEAVAADDESFNETVADADTTGNGVPDENVEGVYDALFDADADAAGDVIHREGGTYEAVRLVISTEGGATAGDATSDTRRVAESLDGDGLVATATGQEVVYSLVEQELFTTVIESLLVTLVAVFAFLMVGYRFMHGSATLGMVTLLPITFAVAWILGTMYVLDIPFNVLTGTITSLTVGLGIAYNIHMSERYVLERRRGRPVDDALYRSVTGTGGALLGSAATTVGGFGVLLFAILPPLQQFGLITSLTITYAFLGSVFVLPSMLVLWTRHLEPPALEAPDSEEAVPVGSNGGTVETDREQ